MLSFRRRHADHRVARATRVEADRAYEQKFHDAAAAEAAPIAVPASPPVLGPPPPPAAAKPLATAKRPRTE